MIHSSLNTLNTRVYQVIFSLLFSFITYSFFIKGSGTPPPFPHIDKVGHIGCFILLTVTFIKAFNLNIKLSSLYLISYGALIEFLQGLTEYRQASIADLVADVLGVLIGLYIIKWLNTPRAHNE